MTGEVVVVVVIESVEDPPGVLPRDVGLLTMEDDGDEEMLVTLMVDGDGLIGVRGLAGDLFVCGEYEIDLMTDLAVTGNW